MASTIKTPMIAFFFGAVGTSLRVLTNDLGGGSWRFSDIRQRCRCICARLVPLAQEICRWRPQYLLRDRGVGFVHDVFSPLVGGRSLGRRRLVARRLGLDRAFDPRWVAGCRGRPQDRAKIMMFAMIIIGGGVGAVLRWLVTVLFGSSTAGFPIETTVANITGSFALGLIYGLGISPGTFDTDPLTVGVLGGFTTSQHGWCRSMGHRMFR